MRLVSRFDRLYRDNFPFVWAAAHRCGAPAEAVDDVVQDVFVTAYRRLDELDWEISPRGWLYGVTRRVAFRYRRSAARTARRNTAVAANAKRSDRPHHRQDAARALESLLGQIDETQREVFVMAEILGLSAPEIAAELAVPVNTVYSRLRLARKRLARIAGSERALMAEVDKTRRADKPTRKEQERTYAALMPVLGSQWLPYKTAVVTTAKSAALPAVAVVIALTSYAITVATNEGEDVDATEEVAEVAEPTPSRDRPYGPPPPKVLTEEEVGLKPAGVAPAPAATPTGSGAAAPTPTPAVLPNRAPAAPPPSSPNDLSAEVALIDAAKAALDRGDAGAALTSLEQHAAKFPAGQLTEARRATRVRALCKAGKTAQAETEAAALQRDYPNSNVASTTPTRCPTP